MPLLAALAVQNAALRRIRADLAGRMGVSPGRISQILSGSENLTLRTLAALAVALDGQFELELKSHKATGNSYTG